MNNPIRFNDPSGHCVGAQGHEFPDGHPACNVGDNSNDGGPVDDLGSDDDDTPINDPNWDDEKDIVKRTRLVWNAICKAGGWWGEGCPSEQELVTWLLYEEGGPLLTSEYEENMARGMRYRFAYFGATDETFIVQLSAFTAFYNPDSDGDFDQADWDTITNPPYDLTRSASIVKEIYESKIKPTDGNYMYWWDGDEVKTDRSKWPGTLNDDYFQTTTVKDLLYYFTGVPDIQNCAMRGIHCRK